MRRELVKGMVAGATGTVALNIVTYLDQAVRGRPSSTVPEQTAGELAERVGLDLGEMAGNRKQGLGPLLGVGIGLGLGAAYGLSRVTLRNVPLPAAAAALGLLAMAASDVPAAVLRLTDPREWSPASWVSDVLPHLGYGTVTAVVYDSIA
ncbi:hypothetical protein GCM10023194_47170 [Planotetraspora phitsanulokensis]|uniref:DUF1440 domain-containing protein n=1 Tax=Planotetraspora phitsanulokensis TaxID=575192 RepID=A0A8J3XJ95_9ACTN|nr:hypothetical protein [Planotetraspora phitsanulokensis]GII43189.1 hypothetical protein Pph01_81920 [Planotetraspora phitsanulokensis]